MRLRRAGGSRGASDGGHSREAPSARAAQGTGRSASAAASVGAGERLLIGRGRRMAHAPDRRVRARCSNRQGLPTSPGGSRAATRFEAGYNRDTGLMPISRRTWCSPCSARNAHPTRPIRPHASRRRELAGPRRPGGPGTVWTRACGCPAPAADVTLRRMQKRCFLGSGIDATKRDQP